MSSEVPSLSILVTMIITRCDPAIVLHLVTEAFSMVSISMAASVLPLLEEISSAFCQSVLGLARVEIRLSLGA